jgi:hypothetical protein
LVINKDTEEMFELRWNQQIEEIQLRVVDDYKFIICQGIGHGLLAFKIIDNRKLYFKVDICQDLVTDYIVDKYSPIKYTYYPIDACFLRGGKYWESWTSELCCRKMDDKIIIWLNNKMIIIDTKTNNIKNIKHGSNQTIIGFLNN